MQWVKHAVDVPISDDDRVLLENLSKPDWFAIPELTSQLRSVLEPLAAHYFLKARTSKGRLIDSVERFHIGNGARLERIDWLGDLSPKGLRESAGIMVNYLYRLDDIEKNHEAYANHGEIAASSAVKRCGGPPPSPRTENSFLTCSKLILIALIWRPPACRRDRN